MKKLLMVLVVVALVVAVAAPAGAQEKMALNIGANVMFPLGDFGTTQGVGFGGTVQGEYYFMPQLAGTVKIGYMTWGGKDVTESGITVTGGSYKGVPLLVGAKYFFMPPKAGAINWYGQAELGLFFGSYTIPAQTISYFGYSYTTPEASASSTDFTLSPTVGAQFPMGKGNLDAGVNYFLITRSGSSASSFGVRVGYQFPI